MYLKLTDQSFCVNLEMQFAFQLGNRDVLFEINIWGHSRSELGNNHNLRECFHKQSGEQFALSIGRCERTLLPSCNETITSSSRLFQIVGICCSTFF